MLSAIISTMYAASAIMHDAIDVTNDVAIKAATSGTLGIVISKMLISTQQRHVIKVAVCAATCAVFSICSIIAIVHPFGFGRLAVRLFSNEQVTCQDGKTQFFRGVMKRPVFLLDISYSINVSFCFKMFQNVSMCFIVNKIKHLHSRPV
jgi:hypothetical protein